MSTVLDTLITDRTADDLTNDTDRAYIAYTDLNRVEEACGFLAGLLHIDIRTKVWGMEDFRTDTEMSRLLDNIRKLRAAYHTKGSTPATPVKITYSSIYQANDIERILKDLGDMYASMVSGQQRLAFRLGMRAIGNRR
jgi:hypothetical protein|nr:MAG TPA: hypothetical protein [Caudoviricetes sp.]